MPKNVSPTSAAACGPDADDAWDEDTSPVWTQEMFDRAEIRHGDVLIRAATGTVTKPMMDWASTVWPSRLTVTSAS